MPHTKISLCTITGNCEPIINRFLDTFAPHVDEIIIVRAVGSQPPDKTLDIAKARGCIVGEYHNTKDFPHVDDFGAARNVAWEMATGDWVMWADIDDAIHCGAEIRNAVSRADDTVNCIWAPYDVPEQAISENYRERIVRRGAATWVGEVHETMAPTDKPLVYLKTKAFRVIHAPVTDRAASAERNMRIMESCPQEDWPHGFYFYAFTECRALGRMADAVRYAQQFLSHPGSKAAEKYEILLQMSAIACEADETEQGRKFLHHAYSVDPTRAEALYQLANLELSLGTPSIGRAYIEQAMTCKITHGQWNARKMMYGWARDDMRWQAMRMTGEGARANVEQFNAFRRNGGKISLLHATRGRVEMATTARTAWLNAATHPDRIEHIFAIDDDDDETASMLSRFRCVIVPRGGGCVRAWNVAAQVASGDLFVQLSDDWEPVAGWDELLLDAAGDLDQPKVLRVRDGYRQDGLLCMAICTRAHWQDRGYLFHPDFRGMYSDNFFTREAERLGRIVDTGITFRHMHPAFGAGHMDEQYQRQNAPEEYSHGKSVFEKLCSSPS